MVCEKNFREQSFRNLLFIKGQQQKIPYNIIQNRNF